MLSNDNDNNNPTNNKGDSMSDEPDIHDQRNHLLSLYRRADHGRLGIIFKDDLIQVL